MYNSCQLLRNYYFIKLVNRSSLPLRFYVSSSLSENVTSSNAAAEEQIEIPNRIKRSPTDILQALSCTVGNDLTAAHYKYHDDPYLIPTSNITKRSFAMAQESGRKAARWIRQEHRDLFQHSNADPPVKAFIPQIVFDEQSEVDENCLKNLIRDSAVNDAIFVYKLMKSKNLTVNDDLKQDLLELICFYNHNDDIPDEFIEERWFKQSSIGRGRQRNTWKDCDLAEEIFQEIAEKTNQSYAAIIRGMCKYYQVEKAWHLFQQANERNIELDSKTYDAIISIVSYLKETGEQRWELCNELLQQMKQQKLKPSLSTLNAILKTISSISDYRLARMSLLKTLSEFKNIGIEPCLGSWYYVLIILCRERGPVSHSLIDILQHIEGKEFQISDPKDTFFFVTAMDVCRNHLNDKNLAKRVNKILHTGNNYNFIGDSYKESIYYRHYFALLCQTESIEEFFETYDLLVPNVYIPEPGIMEEILKAIDINGAIELIPKMWSDMVMFDHITRETLLIRILKIMTVNKPDLDNPKHSELNEKFAIIAWDIYSKINEQFVISDNGSGRGRSNGASSSGKPKISFTGQMLGDILYLLSRVKDYEKAEICFTTIDKNQHQIPGVPSPESITEFVDLCINEKMLSKAINCVKYCTENNLMNPNELVKKIKDGFALNDLHLAQLKSIVGDLDILK